jgi:AraC-like DNA-binding protein
MVERFSPPSIYLFRARNWNRARPGSAWIAPTVSTMPWVLRPFMVAGSAKHGHRLDPDRLRAEPAHRGCQAHAGDEGSSFEEIAAEVGYENQAFFRSLFKRSTGLTPGRYRRMFRPIATAAALPAPPESAAP